MDKSIKLCRLCLNKSQITFDLVNNEENATMLQALTQIKVGESDEISTVVCLKCRLNLRLAYHIQQSMINAEKKFKERITDTIIMIIPEDIEVEEMIIKIEDEGEENCDSKCRTNYKRCAKCHRSILLSKYKSHMLRHNSIHICEFCGYTVGTKKLLKLHSCPRTVTVKARKKKYVCQLCKKVFMKLSVREAHLKNEHQSMEYSCQTCDKKFASITALHAHEYRHRRKACPICNKLVLVTRVVAHIETHKDVSVMCDICGVTLKNNKNLKQHIFYIHNDSRFKCEHCERVFKKQLTLNLHVRKQHFRQADFICEMCGRKFYTMDALNSHVKKVHLKISVSHPCGICQKGFSSSTALRAHRRQHTNETPYKCEVCAEGFRHKVSLKWHRKSKHGIVEAIVANCEICGKGFSTKIGLDIHTRIHV